ncbi:MAG: nucleotide exchange factor GrpE [Alteromonadaceae bacterium]|uniref:nucleotide exchange factor GrpE n=1 Tax=Marinobacter sp. V034 TaxID=3459610 RepID=UPI000C3B4174|nr:nucleotide exchange factor GrpE [Alteromonadaceae bacterium]MBH86627.1 nucleotide exchange factor GrpE [Alteromonadaceae bacterium]|tara:strand:+ start:26498 stop:27130 length:633 start_codon:yes stop_codon:yes gene_type:complete
MSADETRKDNGEEELRDPREEFEPMTALDDDDVVIEGGVSGEKSDQEGSEVEALEQQLAEQKEQVLRVQAEMQNVRRRSELDVEKARKFALEKFVKELLPVADSLEKAVESTEAASGDAVVASFREGAEMTLGLFLSSLGKFNVKQLNPVGEPFDPQLHEAMSMVPAPDAEPNSVVACIQKGYTLNDRLVRPAMVMIAKPEGGAKIDEQA